MRYQVWYFAAQTMKPHDGGGRGGLLEAPHRREGGPGEVDVDAGVGGPGLATEHGAVGHRVEQRPEGRVTTAVVKFLEHLLAAIDKHIQHGPEHPVFYRGTTS